MKRFILFAFLVAPVAAAAQTTSTSPAKMIGDIYNISLMIGGILAVGFVIWGGARYIFNAGNPSGTSAAKENIYNALKGLILLLGAYVILYTINPTLTNLSMPDLEKIPAYNKDSGGTNTNQNAFTQGQTQEKVSCGGTVDEYCPHGTNCYNQGNKDKPNFSCLTPEEMAKIEESKAKK